MLGKKKKAIPQIKKAVEPVKYDTITTEDGVYKTTLTESYKSRKGWVRPDQREVYSFIPGTILSLDSPVGTEVKKGDKLLMFKAMKMDNTYLSPISGKVAKIHVEVGQIVPKGVLLLTFE